MGTHQDYQIAYNEGIRCTRNKVYRLLKLNNIQYIMISKFKATSNSKHNNTVAPNLFKPEFLCKKTKPDLGEDIIYTWSFSKS